MRSLLLSLCLWLALAASARAQSPELLSAYPAGGRRGTTVALTLRGHHLQNVTAVLVSGKGLRAAFAPGNKDELNLPLRLTIAPDAPLGPYELRVATSKGGSNPTQVWVDTLPESLTVEPNDDIAHAQPLDTLPVLINGWLSAPTARDTFAFHANAGETFVFDLNCWRHRSQMDGVLELYDARGALLQLATAPWESDPRLIYTFDRAGRYFLTVHDTQFLGGPQHTYRLSVGRLPVLTAYQPRAGRPGETLTLAVQGVNLTSPSPAHCKSRLFRNDSGRLWRPPRTGGGSRQNADSPVLPHSGRSWEKGRDDGYRSPPSVLEGRGAIKLTLPADAVPGEVCWIAPETPNGLALPIALWGENLPVASGQAGRQVLAPPIAVNGAIAKPGDAPTFRFQARAGQNLRFDVLVQRLGAAMDSALRILDAGGKELAANDDGGTLLAGAAAGIGKDSRLEWKAPANGVYRVEVTNLTGQGGPNCFFRLEIVPVVPDFRLLLNAAKTDVAQGGATILTAAAERTGDFEGEIHLRAEGLPPGVTCSEGVIPAGKPSAEFTLAAEPGAAPDFRTFRIVGRATIAGKTVEREAIPREQYLPRAIDPGMFTDDSYRQPYRPCLLNPLAVTELAESFTLRADPVTASLAPGKPLSITLRAARKPGTDGEIKLSVRGLPEGFKADLKPIAAKTSEVAVTLTAPEKAAPQTLRLIFVGALDKQTQVCPMLTVNSAAN